MDDPPIEAGRRLRADAERNRLRILVAAAEVFARQGLDAGLDEIARHAGVGTGTVYRRFPDKAELIAALFETHLDGMLQLTRQALANPDPWAGLVQFLERSVEMQLADRGLKELLFGDGDTRAQVASRFAATIEQLQPLVTGLVTRAQAAGQLRDDVSFADLAILQFMLSGVGAYSAEVSPQLWRRQLALSLAGLRPSAAQDPLPLEPLTLEELRSLPGSRAGRAPSAEASRLRQLPKSP